MDPAPVADRTPPASPEADLQTLPPEAARCPFPHATGAAPQTDLTVTPAPQVVADVGTPAPVPAPPASAEARCPVPHGIAKLAPGCPVPHGTGATTGPVERSKADRFVRRLLRIRERPAGVTAATAYSTFQRSMAISATRCTLTYVVFPFVLPAAGFASGVGPVIGIVIGTLALVCDTFTIRRFFAVDHKWRWHFSAIAFGIMCLLSVLLVQDVSHVAGNLLG